MQVCFIHLSDISLQQMESFTSPRFTLLQRHSFMEKNKTNNLFVIFPILIKETLNIHTNQKNFFSVHHSNSSQNLHGDQTAKVHKKRTGQLETMKLAAILKSPDQKQLKPNKQKENKIKSNSTLNTWWVKSQNIFCYLNVRGGWGWFESQNFPP